MGGHALTITRVAFSPDDRMILSVSRDRTWRLFARNDDQSPAGGKREAKDGSEQEFKAVALASDRSHARVIWDCVWAKEGDLFATAGRDKLVRFLVPGLHP